MKKLKTIFYIVSLFGLSSNAQSKILKYEEITSQEYLKSIENDEKIKGFIISTGDTIQVNQIIKFGKLSHDRPTYSGLVNKKVNRYSSIYSGKTEVKTILRFQYFPEGYVNKEVKILNIIGKKIRKKHSAIIMLELKLEDDNLSYMEFIGLPQSFEIGELIVVGGKLTKELALKKLKEAKEKLDLELITQEEYNKIKLKLSPVIMSED